MLRKSKAIRRKREGHAYCMSPGDSYKRNMVVEQLKDLWEIVGTRKRIYIIVTNCIFQIWLQVRTPHMLLWNVNLTFPFQWERTFLLLWNLDRLWPLSEQQCTREDVLCDFWVKVREDKAASTRFSWNTCLELRCSPSEPGSHVMRDPSTWEENLESTTSARPRLWVGSSQV